MTARHYYTGTSSSGSRGPLAIVAALFFAGCTTTQVKMDHRELRTVLMDYQDAQILDNLIRAYNGLPIVHFDFSHVSAAVTSKLSGTANGGQTLTNGSSRTVTNTIGNTGTKTHNAAGATTGVVDAVTGTLATAAAVTGAAVRPFSFSLTPDRENVIGVEVTPVLDDNKLYAAYVRFLKAADDQSGAASIFIASDSVTTEVSTSSPAKKRLIQNAQDDLCAKTTARAKLKKAPLISDEEADALKAAMLNSATAALTTAKALVPPEALSSVAAVKAAEVKLKAIQKMSLLDIKNETRSESLKAADNAITASQNALEIAKAKGLQDGTNALDGETTTKSSSNLDFDLSKVFTYPGRYKSLSVAEKKPAQGDAILGPKYFNGNYYSVPNNYRRALFELSMATVARGSTGSSSPSATGAQKKTKFEQNIQDINERSILQGLLNNAR